MLCVCSGRRVPLLVHMTGFGGIGSMLLLLHSAGRWLKPKWHVQLLAARSLGPATSFPFQDLFPHGGLWVFLSPGGVCLKDAGPIRCLHSHGIARHATQSATAVAGRKPLTRVRVKKIVFWMLQFV